MNQCVRCQGLCDSSSPLCDQCRSLLQEHDTLPLSVQEGVTGVVGYEEHRPPFADRGEQSLNYLNAAAKRIAEVDPEARAHSPRPSRLTPLRDISADIQRDSTPLPPSAFITWHGHQAEAQQEDSLLESAWTLDEPEEDAAEEEEVSEKDAWANQPDPLLTRRLPSLAESLNIEEEDIRRILGDRVSTMLVGVRARPRRYLRLFLIWVAICALVALVIDSTMLSLLGQHGPGQQVVSGSPLLTLSKSRANYGDTIIVHLHNFSPDGSVALSRNIGEQLFAGANSSLVVMNASGARDMSLTVPSNWTSGIQTIEAEDVHTHYTASAILLLDTGSPQPANLIVSTTTLDFGSDIQGASTLRTLMLSNTGGGSISWSASSKAAWLLLTPAHGIFSGQQMVQIAVDRSHLKPGNYTGKITIVSNVGKPVVIDITMSVQSIPEDAGAVLSVAPPVLSFIAVDGGSSPATQYLTVSNLGHKSLYWTAGTGTLLAPSQNAPYINGAKSLATTPWLQLQKITGQIDPGSSDVVGVAVHSNALLPGTYTRTVNFGITSGHRAYNHPQMVAVSLTILPSCSVALSTGSLSFTAVSGQPVNTQSLSLQSSASCQSAVNWQATSSQPWLSVSPSSGSVANSAPASTIVSVNTSGLKPGTYTAAISVTANQSSQTVLVQLTVQSAPAPSIPDIGVSPQSVNFSVPAGTSTVPAQALVISNTGQDTLYWQASTLTTAPWLAMGNTSGVVQTGATGQLVLDVSTSGLTPGTYSTQIQIAGSNATHVPAGDSPQTINVTLTVNAPCVVTMPSSSSLLFNATQGGTSPAATQVMLTASGDCTWPIKWSETTSASATNWVVVSPASGSFTASGQSTALAVSATTSNLVAGTYHGSIAISATDANGLSVGGGSLTLSTTLTIQPPCAVVSSSSGVINLSVGQGTASAPTSVALATSGNCVWPVTWTATATTTSGGSWLKVLSSTGSDSGSGSTLTFKADATNLVPGTYSGTISLSANDASSAPSVTAPQITVQLVVTGYTVTGNVTQCDGTATCTPMPAVGKTVTLTNSSGVSVTAVTDSNGAYQFTNVANDTYTVSASGQSTTATFTVSNGAVVAPILNVTVTPPTTVPVVTTSP